MGGRRKLFLIGLSCTVVAALPGCFLTDAWQPPWCHPPVPLPEPTPRVAASPVRPVAMVAMAEAPDPVGPAPRDLPEAVKPAPERLPPPREVGDDKPAPTVAAQPAAEPVPDTPQAAKGPDLHPLAQAFQLYLDERPEEAVQVLAVFEPKDQEFFLRLFPVLAKVARGGVWNGQAGKDEVTALLQALQAANADLRRVAPLVIEKILFCEKDRVRGFGQPVPTRGVTFRPGDKVCIYAEVQNLADRQVKEDQYQVRLGGTLEILDAACKVKWGPVPVRGTPNWSQSPRLDHFTTIDFVIPALPPGSYTLRVRLTDQDTQREADKCLGFRVASSTVAHTMP